MAELFVSRRTLLLAATAALQCHVTPTLAQANEKAAFMKAAIASINRTNNRRLRKQTFLAPQLLPVIKPFGDWDYFYILGPIEWHPNIGQTLNEVTVPKGFVTDLASIPRLFWSALPKTGRYAYAAVLHDYLYWTQSTTRQEADKILETAMSDSGVDHLKIRTITVLVEQFGQSAWDNNNKLKQSGAKRFLKEFPDNPLISWEEWQKNPAHFAD